MFFALKVKGGKNNDENKVGICMALFRIRKINGQNRKTDLLR